MFALCDFSETTVNIVFGQLEDGFNMFRKCNIVNIGEFEVPKLNKAGGFLGECKLNSESALKVITYVKTKLPAVTDISKGPDYYMTMGVSASLMNDTAFREAAGLPEEVPPTAAS
jgi:hypothetical protein